MAFLLFVCRESAQNNGGDIASFLSIDTEGGDGCDNPFNSAYSHTSRSSVASSLSPSLASPSIQYRDIQKGGEIPFSGLRKAAPATPPHRDGKSGRGRGGYSTTRRRWAGRGNGGTATPRHHPETVRLLRGAKIGGMHSLSISNIPL